ncbi:hypothetical protein EIN_331750, partial [Entamoeba invadens IP1]
LVVSRLEEYYKARLFDLSSNAWTSFSIALWYYGFTKIQGHHRLLAAAMVVEKYYKDTIRAELLRRRAQDLSTLFEKLFWNEEKGYFVQVIWQDNKKQKVIVDTLTATIAFSDIVTDQIKIKNTLITSESSTPNLNTALQYIHKTQTFILQSGTMKGKEVGEATPLWGEAVY